MNKKNIIASVIAASIFSVNAFEQASTPMSFSDIAVSELTRNDLLATNRLVSVDGQKLAIQNEMAVAAIRTQLENAIDGQTIALPSGKFVNLGIVTISASNVTIKAENAGEAWLTGLVQLELKGDDITVDGLVFTEGGPAEENGGVRMMGDRNTLQNTTFYYFNHDYEYEPDERRSEFPKYEWVSLWGKEGKVVNNRFEGKQKRGALLGVQKDETPDNHIIANNIFLDQQQNQFNELDIKEAIRYNGNSWEAIRIGNSWSSQSKSNTKVINNLLINMDGERELISIKSGGNVIGGNTFFESAALISLRHGKANKVKSNVFLGNGKNLTGGMRVYDENHVISNNYIVGTRGRDGEIAGNADLRGGVVLNTGIIDVANGEVLDQSIEGKELTKQWTPKNIIIKNNTLIDAEYGFVYGDQSHRVSLFDDAEVENTFTAVNVDFDSNIIDNTKNPDFVSVNAAKGFNLVNATYTNETYTGTLTEAEQVGKYSVELPESIKINGFVSFKGAGADVNELKIVTAETAGTTYKLTNTFQR